LHRIHSLHLSSQLRSTRVGWCEHDIASQCHRQSRFGRNRQCEAARLDRRTLPARKPGACVRNGLGPQRNCKPRGDGSDLQDEFRQGQPTSAGSKRGLGLERSLPILAEIREALGIPVLTTSTNGRNAHRSPKRSMSFRYRRFYAGRPIFSSRRPRRAES